MLGGSCDCDDWPIKADEQQRYFYIVNLTVGDVWDRLIELIVVKEHSEYSRVAGKLRLFTRFLSWLDRKSSD